MIFATLKFKLPFQMENHPAWQLVRTPGPQQSKSRLRRKTTYARSGVVVNRPPAGSMKPEPPCRSDPPGNVRQRLGRNRRHAKLSRRLSYAPRPAKIRRDRLGNTWTGSLTRQGETKRNPRCRALAEKADEFSRQQNGLEKAA